MAPRRPPSRTLSSGGRKGALLPSTRARRLALLDLPIGWGLGSRPQRVQGRALTFLNRSSRPPTGGMRLLKTPWICRSDQRDWQTYPHLGAARLLAPHRSRNRSAAPQRPFLSLVSHTPADSASHRTQGERVVDPAANEDITAGIRIGDIHLVSILPPGTGTRRDSPKAKIEATTVPDCQTEPKRAFFRRCAGKNLQFRSFPLVAIDEASADR